MESSFGTRESVNAQRLNQDFVVVDGCSDPTNVQDVDVVVRMAVPDRPMWHFIDEGEEVELYVTFADGVVGIPCTNRHGEDDGEYSYKVICINIVYGPICTVHLFVTREDL